MSIMADLERITPPWAIHHLGPTIDGDADAAVSLYVGLHDYQRGLVAVALRRLRIPVPAYREFLHATWDHDHRYLIAAAGDADGLRDLFTYAEFDLPGDLPETVTVWRGTSALSLEDAKAGYSWTTSRDCACWFAMRFAERNGSPLVLRATIARNHIALYTDERNESEVVLLSPPKSAIDGSHDDWNRGYTRIKAQRNLTSKEAAHV